MQISVLASGSKGNCVLVNDGDTAVLIDAGISARKIKKELANLHMDINDLSGILITHEHIDHVRGLKTLSKNYHVPIFTRSATFKAMPFLAQIPVECCNVLADNELKIGELAIEPFSISHDAVDPVGYSIKTISPKSKFKFTLATDLGFVTEPVKQALDNSDVIVLEANHDVNLLQNGPYPWSLKKRILGNRGHLSNSDAGWTLRNLAHKPDAVILAHLSEKNNTPSTAVDTIKAIMEQEDTSAAHFSLQVASPDKTVHINY